MTPHGFITSHLRPELGESCIKWAKYINPTTMLTKHGNCKPQRATFVLQLMVFCYFVYMNNYPEIVGIFSPFSLLVTSDQNVMVVFPLVMTE